MRNGYITKTPRVVLSLSFPDHRYRLLAFNLRLHLCLCSICHYFTVVNSPKFSKRATTFQTSYPAAIACSFHGNQADVGQLRFFPLSIMLFTSFPLPSPLSDSSLGPEKKSFGRICIIRVWKTCNSAIVIVFKATVLNLQP